MPRFGKVKATGGGIGRGARMVYSRRRGGVRAGWGRMHWIETRFVRAKHWQIFILFVVIFAVGELPAMGSFTSALQSPENSAEVLLLTEIALAVSACCYLLWLWSLGSFLSTVVKPALRLKKGFFLFTIICSALYFIASIALIQSLNPGKFVLLPLSLFGVFCGFANLYFVAEGLKLAETGERASFFACAGPFFLLWFFLIGVWFIQPRINRLYAARQKNAAAAEPVAI